MLSHGLYIIAFYRAGQRLFTVSFKNMFHILADQFRSGVDGL